MKGHGDRFAAEIPILSVPTKHDHHYGVGNEYYDDYGHALHLALGFTFETTVAMSRFICSGVLDKVPSLKLILAHCMLVAMGHSLKV